MKWVGGNIKLSFLHLQRKLTIVWVLTAQARLALFCTNLVDINSKIMFELKEENEMGGREHFLFEQHLNKKMSFLEG